MNKFTILYEEIQEYIANKNQEFSNEEIIEEYNYQNYKIQIVKLLDVDEESYGFIIYEYDENNILSDWPVFESGGSSEIESIEEAKEQAQEWIEDYEEPIED